MAQRGKNNFNFSHLILSSQVPFPPQDSLGILLKGSSAVGRKWSRSSSVSFGNLGPELVPDNLCCFSCGPQAFKAAAGNIPLKSLVQAKNVLALEMGGSAVLFEQKVSIKAGIN